MYLPNCLLPNAVQGKSNEIVCTALHCIFHLPRIDLKGNSDDVFVFISNRFFHSKCLQTSYTSDQTYFS